MSVSHKTLSIKARVYNQIRKDLYKKTNEDIIYNKLRGLEFITDEQKIELFNKWFDLNKEAHNELNEYKKKRKYKKTIQEDRIKRGVTPKVKMSKEQYQQLQHAI